MKTRLLVIFFLMLAAAAQAGDWWDKEWTVRKKITIDTTDKGAAITEPIGTAVVLIRLFEGNFQFNSAKEDGSDIRFVSEDGKTVLTHHIERFDSLLNSGFVWVKVPDLKPGAAASFYMYYGNAGPKANNTSDSKSSFDADTVLVYHFGERTGQPNDFTKNANNAQAAGSAIDVALIGGGLRLTGTTVTVPKSESLSWKIGAPATFSAWVKLGSLQPNAVLLSQRDGGSAFVIGFDNGVPYVEITDAAGTNRSSAGAPLEINQYHHLAVVADVGKLTVYLDGASYGSLTGSLPELAAPLLIDGDTAEGATGLRGELDELQISKTARPPGFIKLASLTESAAPTVKAIAMAEDEGGGKSSGGEGGHGGYFTVIVASLTPDGWAVIILLGVMAVISWYVMITKIGYLNAMAKGNAMFMKAWLKLSSDLTALDNADPNKIKSLGGNLDEKAQRNLRVSSVYRIYHIGAEEIRHRMAAEHSTGALSGRSIQAIRAALDGGLIREKQIIDKLIVLLTICISGGPFLGLLGTVVGVMITFAAVAAAGDVNVNAIAPGIAAALLATVAGLAVAIPSLFGYNYILARVKDATADMHVFIDEFVTKMAEFYAGDHEGGRTGNNAPVTMAMLHELLQGKRSNGVEAKQAFVTR